MGKTIELEHSFASEAPGSAGLQQKRMLLMNCKPKVIYDDLLASDSDFSFGMGYTTRLVFDVDSVMQIPT